MIAPISTVATLQSSTKTITIALLVAFGALLCRDIVTDSGCHSIINPYHVDAFQVSPPPLQRNTRRDHEARTPTNTVSVALCMMTFSSPSLWSSRNPAAGGKDFYRILGVSRTATQPEIKQAFRRLVKQYHPDANPNKDTTEQFQIINRAYQVLMDPHQRRQYNARMNYSTDTPHFIVSDFEDHVDRRPQRSSQSSRKPFNVYDPSQRIFLTNSNSPFRVSECE